MTVIAEQTSDDKLSESKRVKLSVKTQPLVKLINTE